MLLRDEDDREVGTVCEDDDDAADRVVESDDSLAPVEALTSGRIIGELEAVWFSEDVVFGGFCASHSD